MLPATRASHRVHEEREVARLRQRCLAAVKAHRQETADAVVHCLKERAPHVGLAWLLLVRGDIFAGGRRRRENHSCCITRHKRSSWSTATLTERLRLGRFSTCSITTLSCAAAKRGTGNRERIGPLVRHGPEQARKNFPRNTAWMHRALGNRKEPHSTSRRASSLPGVGAPGQLPSRDDCRTTRPQCEPHTAQSTETTLPPCKRSTIL